MIDYHNVQSLLEKWKRILHLEDWEITVLLVPQSIFEDRLQSGDCAIRKTYSSADIRLATYETLDLVSAPTQADMERTLVHELLHCVFRYRTLGEDPHPWAVTAYEHSIEQMARSFVELDRQRGQV